MQKKKKFRFDISLGVVISSIAVLTILLTLMSFLQFQLRKTQALSLFIEKGATLIQSFEAGLRNQPPQQEFNFYLQKLLMETAQQPDIDYMVVTDDRGNIVADSDPTMMDKQYGLDLEIGKTLSNQEIHWRQTANPGGAGTFEVYRQLHLQLADQKQSVEPRWIVYVGFNMNKIESAEHEDSLRMIIIAVILILIGSLAIVALFLVQKNRLTRASLSRMTLFSEALVKNMPAALLALDKEGKVITCNEEAEGLVSGSCPEAVGQDASLVLPQSIIKIINQIHEKTGFIEEEIILPSPKGEDQIWEVIAAAFANEDVPEGKLLLARNVTAIRSLEKEVAKSRHLNAIGSLAAGVAHEIRNPLSSIRGLALYFKGRLAGNAEDEETADIMIAETERLNRVITQLIEFARPLELKKELTDLVNLADQTVKLIAAEAKGKSVEIDMKKTENIPFIPIDPDKIKQVLLNIYLNALAAMPAGGRITIAFHAENEHLAMTVSDTGEGIAEDDLPRIYDPYFTSKPAGTGLGLAVVQKFMEAHGGLVRIDSRPKAGTTVTLRFALNDYKRGAL